MGSAHAAGSSGVGARQSLLPERYRVVGRVAVGGMGSIWAVDDQVLGRRVAVKVLAEHLASQPLFVKRFEREARTAAALSGHPNVITIHDVGEHQGRPFIVMAYLPGGTLRDRLEHGPVEGGLAVEWIRQAAAALDFAHGRGVVHRDVKPQNLLFDDDGRLVVADLGIARAAYEDNLTASGELLGTASYISPEQATGAPATPASDRYSLAIVAYELLTGSRPFGGAGFAEQALQQVESEPQPPSERAPLPSAVDGVLAKGLAKDPGARWESASELASALDEALTRRPATPPRADTPIDPERRWPRDVPVRGRRRFRVPLVAIAAGTLLALVAGVAILVAGGEDRPPAKRAERATKQGRQRAGSDRAGGRTSPAPAAPAPAPAPASAAALNDEGFRLMRGGRYAEAIPVLRRAVAPFPAGSRELTYAYALYNLGRSLRLAGRPAEAVPLLERRLRFDNQRDVVRRELAAARAAAG